MQRDSIAFHNVDEFREVDGREGLLLQRVPESVRTELNDGAQNRMCHPAGVELRFVPDGPVELTLSTRPANGVDSGTARVFWGPIQGYDTVEIGPEPTTVELTPPEKLETLRPDAVADLAFDPNVCRVRLPGEHRGGHVFYHGVDGGHRLPRDDEVPGRRYLAYGTSITEGEAPVAEHLTYVNQAATRLDVDPINLGSCGTAFCDAAMADYIAERGDWDVATLALSVNMIRTFPVSEFRERAEYMVNTVAAAHPDDPVVPITIYRNARDVCEDADRDGECDRFREALRDIVRESPHDNLHLLEGMELLPDVGGLTTDLVHPGDNAMIRMGENLAAEIDELL